MTNFLPTLISKLPSVMQEIAVDSLIVATGVTQEQLTAAVDAAVAAAAAAAEALAAASAVAAIVAEVTPATAAAAAASCGYSCSCATAAVAYRSTNPHNTDKS